MSPMPGMMKSLFIVTLCGLVLTCNAQSRDRTRGDDGQLRRRSTSPLLDDDVLSADDRGPIRPIRSNTLTTGEHNDEVFGDEADSFTRVRAPQFQPFLLEDLTERQRRRLNRPLFRPFRFFSRRPFFGDDLVFAPRTFRRRPENDFVNVRRDDDRGRIPPRRRLPPTRRPVRVFFGRSDRDIDYRPDNGFGVDFGFFRNDRDPFDNQFPTQPPSVSGRRRPTRRPRRPFDDGDNRPDVRPIVSPRRRRGPRRRLASPRGRPATRTRPVAIGRPTQSVFRRPQRHEVPLSEDTYVDPPEGEVTANGRDGPNINTVNDIQEPSSPQSPLFLEDDFLFGDILKKTAVKRIEDEEREQQAALEVPRARSRPGPRRRPSSTRRPRQSSRRRSRRRQRPQSRQIPAPRPSRVSIPTRPTTNLRPVVNRRPFLDEPDVQRFAGNEYQTPRRAPRPITRRRQQYFDDTEDDDARFRNDVAERRDPRDDVAEERPKRKKSSSTSGSSRLNGFPIDSDGDGTPGVAGQHYPTYDKVPRTSFSCSDQENLGYYADPEAQCQVFHFCQALGVKTSFLCPNGTLYNQEKLACEWWYNVDCDASQDHYHVNERLYRDPSRDFVDK